MGVHEDDVCNVRNTLVLMRSLYLFEGVSGGGAGTGTKLLCT